jgi:hypothetical protein
MSRMIADFLIYFLVLPIFAMQTGLMIRSFLMLLADLSQWDHIK